MVRQHGNGMIGWIQGKTRWAYDHIRRQEGQRQQTGQEVDYPSEGSMMVGGAGRWDVKITT